MSDLAIKPLDDRVVIQVVPEEEKTASGIIIPDTASKEKPQRGKVVAVGEGRMTDGGTRIPMTVKKGDEVLFTKYGPTEVKLDGVEYLIASESDILAIIS